MSYRNGMLYFKANARDVGKYTEMVTITVKGDGGGETLVVPLRIRVLPPDKNITCPYGSKPNDCMPSIK